MVNFTARVCGIPVFANGALQTIHDSWTVLNCRPGFCSRKLIDEFGEQSHFLLCFVLCVTLRRAGAAYVWINMVLINAFIGPSIMLIKYMPRVQTLIAAIEERMQRAKESILGTPTEEDQTNSMYEETLAYTTAMQQELVSLFASFSIVIVFGML